jgi:hypothetical protein
MLAVYVIDPTSRAALFGPLTQSAVAQADSGEATDVFAHVFECDPDRRAQTLRAMLAWESGDASREGFLSTVLTRSAADIFRLLDEEYSSLDVSSRKVAARLVASLRNSSQMFYRGAPAHPGYQSLLEKMKTDSEPEIRELGEELQARDSGRGGGFF